MRTKKPEMPQADESGRPGTASAGLLPAWPDDKADICARIRAHRAPLKVILKTRNEDMMLPIWLKHHLSFLEPHEIVIADNRSTDPGIYDIYKTLPAETVVFHYDASPTNGFHNTIHNRKIFGELYDALAESADHSLLIDSDELLILSSRDRWSTDRSEILRILAEHAGRALPTVWLEAIPESRDTCYLGTDIGRILNAVAWGKPIVPTAFSGPGFLLHNGQFPADLFDAPGETAFVLLHLPHYSAEQRLAVNRQKLVARGLVSPDTSFEKIARIDTSQIPDPTAQRFVREICEILARQKAPAKDTVPENCILYRPDGSVTFTGERAREIYLRLFSDFEGLMGEAFELAERVLKGKPARKETDGRPEALLLRDAVSAAKRGDAEHAEKLLRDGLERHPTHLDQYGDPMFRKELLRLFLSLGRLDEAEALVAVPDDVGRKGWHHILFARALTAAGEKEKARVHWTAFGTVHPGHPEVLAALRPAGAPAPAPEVAAPLDPRMTPAERGVFEKWLSGVTFLLEFGAGGSTSLAARSGVSYIVSVESDVQWLDRLSRRPEMKGIRFVPFHVDIGPTGAWGTPTDPATARRWPGYYRAVWKKIERTPDLVLVDGRFRVACALTSLLHCAPETPIVIHDFWDRPQYHVVLKYLDCIEQADTIGVFRRKQDIDWQGLAIDLVEHVLDAG